MSIEEIPNYFDDHKVLLQLAENIKKFYMYRHKSVMYLSKIIELLIIKGDVNFLLDEQTCLRGIMALCQICPNWIRIIEHESGRQLKIIRNIGMTEVSKSIHNVLFLSK